MILKYKLKHCTEYKKNLNDISLNYGKEQYFELIYTVCWADECAYSL